MAFKELPRDCDLQFASDGEDVLDYLRRTGKHANALESPRPALILLDLNMPRKDGFEVLREIKADRDFRRIPVIVFTTSNRDDDVDSSYDLGASSYVTKPAS